MKNKYFENEFCEYWIDKHGIINEIFKRNFDKLDIEIAKKILLGRSKLTTNLGSLLYVELGELIKMERRAYRYLWSEASLKNVSAIAILIRDEIERFAASLIINFVTIRGKKNVAIKYFTDKESAVFWLVNQKISALN